MSPAASWLLILVVLLLLVVYTAIVWWLSKRPMSVFGLIGLVVVTLLLAMLVLITTLWPSSAADTASPPCSAQHPHCDHSTPAWLVP